MGRAMILVLLALSMSSHSLAQGHRSEAHKIQATLQKFSEQDLKDDLKRKPTGPLKINEMFQAIRAGTILAISQDVDVQLISELIRVANITIIRDGTQYAFSEMVPLYRAKPALVNRAIQSFPAELASQIRESFRDMERMAREGNG